MNNVDFLTRMIISTILTFIFYLICLCINDTDSVKYFAFGSFGYQIIDWIIYQLRHPNEDEL